MNTPNQVIDSILSTNEFPHDMEIAFQAFIDPKTHEVFPQESLTWDYKQEWPFSFSDDYFGGIVRLICAFSNSAGGVIFFGIHDKKRTAGPNRVRADIEKLNNFLRLHLARPIICKLKEFSITSSGGNVIALLVPLRTKAGLPVWATKPIGKYGPKLIWIRQGHEVLEASSKDLGLLLTGQQSSGYSGEVASVLSVLPPSPAIMRRFVGRMQTLLALFDWLINTDEPRLFLFGKGGSGKTTIAYEFARFLAWHGQQIAAYGGFRIQQVVFLSAKEQRLNTKNASIEPDLGLDFSNEEELYTAILLLTGWRDQDFVGKSSIDTLKEEVRELIDTITTVFIIDDVDTLTTKGKDAGFEYLFKILSRGKLGSKVLYTVRNAPTQSLSNSIEVPGLSPDGEYQTFVEECSAQFNLPKPSDVLRDTAIAKASERRPLVVESIIGLRKTCDSYERALDIFERAGGEDIRKYIFEREWNALPSDNRARHLLCVLALIEKEAEFGDLMSILQFEENTLKDTIASVSEIFLQLEHTGEFTKYGVAALTRSFILGASASLDKFGQVKARVDYFRKSHYPKSPEITRLEINTEAYLRFADGAELAWLALSNKELPDRVTQDPRFQALKGKVACRFATPRISDAREAFSYCFSMKYEPDVASLRLYLDTERRSGIGIEPCIKVCEYVCNGKSYSNVIKCEFWSRKGSFCYHRATESQFANPSDSYKYLREVLTCNARALFISINCNGYQTSTIEKNFRNTCFFCINNCITSRELDEFVFTLTSLDLKSEIYIDPIVAPVEEFVLRVTALPIEKAAKAKILGKLYSAINHITREEAVFFDADAQKSLVAINSKVKQIQG